MGDKNCSLPTYITVLFGIFASKIHQPAAHSAVINI